MPDDVRRSFYALVAHFGHRTSVGLGQLSKGDMQTRTFTVLSKHLVQSPRMLVASLASLRASSRVEIFARSIARRAITRKVITSSLIVGCQIVGQEIPGGWF